MLPHADALSELVPQSALFVMLDRQKAWSAIIAARLLPEVAIHDVDDIPTAMEWLRDEVPACLLLADDAGPPDELVTCVRDATARPETLIVITRRRPSPALAWLLREVGAQAVIEDLDQVTHWLPVIRGFLNQRRLSGLGRPRSDEKTVC